MSGPLGKIRFLYVGSEEFGADLRYYRDAVGARLVWNLKAFGACVAAFCIGEGPLLLIADHRPTPSCTPIFEVKNLKATVGELKTHSNLGRCAWSMQQGFH